MSGSALRFFLHKQTLQSESIKPPCFCISLTHPTAQVKVEDFDQRRNSNSIYFKSLQLRRQNEHILLSSNLFRNFCGVSSFFEKMSIEFIHIDTCSILYINKIVTFFQSMYTYPAAIRGNLLRITAQKYYCSYIISVLLFTDWCYCLLI